jgi:PadR family transcriptional regulator PadR
MRGLLSFTILWLLSKRTMYGQQIANEIGKRRGEKPNPGTIYPALKDLSERGLVESKSKGRTTIYQLTKEGRYALTKARQYFLKAFGDILKTQRRK